jgi:hypothetical protein
MKKLFIPLLLLPFILVQCMEEDDSADQIHYSDLPELTVELITEAGESESYFPSRLNDLYVNSEGSIYLYQTGAVLHSNSLPRKVNIFKPLPQKAGVRVNCLIFSS